IRHTLLSLRPHTMGGLERHIASLNSALKTMLEEPKPEQDALVTGLIDEIKRVAGELGDLRRAQADLKPFEDETFLMARLSELEGKRPELLSKGPSRELANLTEELRMVERKLQVVREAPAKGPEQK